MSTNNNQRTQNTSSNAGASQQQGQSQNTGSTRQSQQRQNASAQPAGTRYQQQGQVYSGAGGQYGQQAASQPVQGSSLGSSTLQTQSTSGGQQSQYPRDIRFRQPIVPSGQQAATGYGQSQAVVSQPVQGQMQSTTGGQQSPHPQEVRFRQPIMPGGQQGVMGHGGTSAPGMGMGAGAGFGGSSSVFRADPIQQNRGGGRSNRGAGASKPSRGRQG